MMRFLRLLLLLLVLPTVSALGQADSNVAWLQGGPYRLKTAIYRTVSRPSSALVVILHGDAPFSKPDYQNRFAAAIARLHPTVVAAAILRPGYTDSSGQTSEGDRGAAIGDSYNATNTDALAAAIVALKAKVPATRLVIIGHSGGAALAASIMSRQPTLASAAILAACPCDVTAWRQHMLQKTKFAGFDGPIATLSPIDLVASLPRAVPIVMLVGERDDVAPPALTKAYAARAQAHGADVTVAVLPREGHEILETAEVLNVLDRLLQK